VVCNFVKVAASVAGLAMVLTGCAVPPPQYVTVSYAPPVDTWDGIYRTTYPAVSYRPAAPPVVQPTPEPTFNPEPVPAPDEQPIDQSCGWWRLCNLWSGS
jgi:hypothetical protein